MENQRRGNAGCVLVFSALLFLAPLSSGYMIYRVGDDDGWTVNANGLDYSKWASQKAFEVGDMLVFEYSASNHTVLQTSNKEAFENCNIEVDDAKIWSAAGSTSANVLLTTPGETYFLCTAWEGSHCRNGMKFGINVLSGGSSNGLMPPTASPTIPSAPAPVSELTPGYTTPGSTIPGSTTPTVITKPSSDSNSPQSSDARTCKVLETTVAAALAIALGVQLVF